MLGGRLQLDVQLHPVVGGGKTGNVVGTGVRIHTHSRSLPPPSPLSPLLPQPPRRPPPNATALAPQAQVGEIGPNSAGCYTQPRAAPIPSHQPTCSSAATGVPHGQRHQPLNPLGVAQCHAPRDSCPPVVADDVGPAAPTHRQAGRQQPSPRELCPRKGTCNAPPPAVPQPSQVDPGGTCAGCGARHAVMPVP